MEPQAVATYAMRLGDDALITAQRLCEWSAKAPTLEEDLALANVGLDYLGRARMCLGYAGELLGKTEDQLAYLRDAREFQNALILELPRGDFAFTMVRQYLLDAFESRFFAALAQSTDARLAAIAHKTLKEVTYHLRRSSEWMKRLGLGTSESNDRSQRALDELWGYVDELFEVDELEQILIEGGVAVAKPMLQADWEAAVGTMCAQVGLSVPNHQWRVSGGRSGVHTEHLGHLLAELQFLQRAYPGLAW